MSITTTVLDAPTEIYTGPWPEGFVVYDWDPKIIASASGHYAGHLGSFGGDRATFGVYIFIYEWPFDRISYMHLLPRVLHIDLEIIGNNLYAYSQMVSERIWWHIPGWRPYGVTAATMRLARRGARALFGRKALAPAVLPAALRRMERPPKPPAGWLADFGAR